MKLTSKKRNIILIGSYIALDVIMIGELWYVEKYHPDSWWWIFGILATEIILLLLLLYVLPKKLEMRVENTHLQPDTYKRIVINGQKKVWNVVGILIISFFTGVLTYAAMLWAQSHRHILFMSLFWCIGMGIFLSPFIADLIQRCIKNTYTIEGNNLIVDEWAWFQRKTNYLVIPIAEITSIRKTMTGWAQLCNVEIEVAGIKRKLATGIVGEELYNALKERMQ